MSGNINFNGWLNDDGSENYKCRAWVNFNGQGTVAIRASGNVASITDLGTGQYQVNFNTAMPDANYVTVCGNGQDDAANGGFRVSNPSQASSKSTASFVNVVSSYIANGTNRVADDCGFFNVSVFR